MNKVELAEKWGNYINTDKLVDDVINLFKENYVKAREKGVCLMLDEFFRNKEPLIRLFQQSPNYIGGLRIAVPRKFKRDRASEQVNCFVSSFDSRINARAFILKKVDDEGHTISDTMKIGCKAISAKSIGKRISNHVAMCEGFNTRTGYTLKSEKAYDHFTDALTHFRYQSEEALDRDIKIDEDEYVRAGRKTSRAFNRLCTYYGLDKAYPSKRIDTHNGVTTERTVYPYDALFAKYSDLVTGGYRDLFFIASLNPLDYLTMSVADNWQSCHHIRHGGWKTGCESYMLDAYSIITFVVDNTEGEIYRKSKIYRTMFHCDYQSGTCVESRIYPQGNDGATDLYSQFAGIMQDIVSPIFGVSNNWESINGTCQTNKNIYNTGTHYKDLLTHNQCLVFWPKEKERLDGLMRVGHACICPCCGETHTYNGRFNCDDCR